MAGPPSDYGALIIAMVVAAGVLAGLIRAYLAHRTRLHAEREASARVAARATGLMGLAERHRGVVRIVERDRDGHREVEFGGREPLLGNDGEEAA
ncbi:hypothetical protein [Actinoplanes utahensis]|uniref:hypothetical protein n=1 Tax=Actinoplanes utahensis TaxID=1869 RepID=UPI001A58DF8E|nr:hypothetical protein [Actinoplanes utahensis]GIF27151.1 hypothetical protein Aut01nite_01370 [Actinoplanes utahensis]